LCLKFKFKIWRPEWRIKVLNIDRKRKDLLIAEKKTKYINIEHLLVCRQEKSI